MELTNAYLGLFRRDADDPTPRELRRILESELKKEAPDADLIEDCLNALAEQNAALSRPARRISRPGKAALIAAAALLCLGTAAAAAQIRPETVSRFVARFDDRIRFDTGAVTNAVPAVTLPDVALKDTLSEHGLGDVHLPTVFFEAAYTQGEPRFQETELAVSADFDIAGEGFRGRVVITRYAPDAAMPVVDYPGAAAPDGIPARYGVSGIDVYVFQSGDTSVIAYAANRTVYTVTLDCPVRTAAEIAKTVR